MSDGWGGETLTERLDQGRCPDVQQGLHISSKGLTSLLLVFRIQEVHLHLEHLLSMQFHHLLVELLEFCLLHGEKLVLLKKRKHGPLISKAL